MLGCYIILSRTANTTILVKQNKLGDAMILFKYYIIKSKTIGVLLFGNGCIWLSDKSISDKSCNDINVTNSHKSIKFVH